MTNFLRPAVICFVLLGLLASVEQSQAQSSANGLVVLATDYGTDSIYVGALKGAVYTKFPEARIDTLTNAIPPYDIVAGAYILAEASREFPRGTTFVSVVDPGVGTDRRAIALETRNGQFFVGPDNGLLHLVAERYGIKELREATNTGLWREGTQSSTFHGRDIFGPVAGAIAGGISFEEVGPPLESMVRLDLAASRIENNVAYGQIIRVDWYGNCITNITAEQLDSLRLRPGDLLSIQAGSHVYTAPFVNTYADVPVGSPVVVIQSFGLAELALNQDNLAERLAFNNHTEVAIYAAQTAAPLPAETAAEPGIVPSTAMPEDTGPIVVVYERSGGLAGQTEELVIRRDGICTFTENGRRKGFNLDQETINGLRMLLASLPAAEDLPTASEPRQGADFLTYRITYHGQAYRVNDLNMPDIMAPVIGRFNEILGKHRSTR